ncbi:MAG: DegV family protein [Clostridia bacterium]|nr:DegV family protein [Clostridia bacterium]
MQTRIITDSSCDMPVSLRKQIASVPLTLTFADTEYIDEVTLSKQKFYEMLIESDVLPKTSQASPDAFSKVFSSVQREGGQAVVITVGSSFSGTNQSANIAAKDYKDIYIVDSESVSIGCGILAEYALGLAKSGMEAWEIKAILDSVKKRLVIIALLDTLEYLKKGGRISKTAAFAGGLLGIKPVISMVQGEIRILGKARGSKHGNNLLVQEIEKTGGVDFNMPVLLGYTGISDALLMKYIRDSESLFSEKGEAPDTTIIGSIIGTHAGPGAIAAAFFKKV